MIIAIDGPAASGKSSTAHGVAEKLQFRHIDTGAMYRAITLKVLRAKLDLSDEQALADAMDTLDLEVTFEGDQQLLTLEGERLGEEIRSPEVTAAVADVSAQAVVRQRLLGVQRAVAESHDVVLEGRDIGTVVFPDAELKIYMIADARVRAQRRQLDFAKQGIDKSLDELEAEILERDAHNANRELAPMKPAEDAIVLDTTHMSIEDQINFIVSKVETLKSNGGNLMTKKQDMDAKVEETEETTEVSAEPQDAVETTPVEETAEAATEPEAVEETVEEAAVAEDAVAEEPETVEETVEEPAVAEEPVVEEPEAVEETVEEPAVAEDAEPAEETVEVASEEVAEEVAEPTEPEAAPVETAVEDAAADKSVEPGQGKRAMMNDLFANIQTLKKGELPEDQEISSKESLAFQELLDHAVIDLDQQSLVEGRIISISDKEVMVDFGFKSEGVVPRHEFDEKNLPAVGETVELFLERIEDKVGQAILSKRKAEFMRVWDNVKQKFADGETVDGTIARRIKGGMVVSILGIDAFLPGSQLDVRPIRDFDAYVGKTFEFKIVKVNEFRKNIVVSRKELLEESLKEQRSKLLDEIEVGQILEGRVKNITDFGVFVDLGGIDGLLHITDLSWGRVNHPSEVVSLDEDIMVKVIDYDTNKQRVSLGLKQLKPHPWESVVEKYPEGTVVNGKVVSLANYGAFIELTAGVEGLVHISEISWTQHIKHPSDVFSVGDEIDAVVLSVDAENHKISLGVKQLQPDPWTTIEEKYVVGSVHKGTVRNLTQFGAFIELEEGIDGLVHISDLSWTSKVRHPKEVVNRGDEIDVKILDISQSERKISLGIKQAQENPWPELKDRFAVNSVQTGSIIKLLEKGVILDFPGTDVEGIIPLGNFRKKERQEILDQFEVGAEVEVKVVEVDAAEKKVVVSHESAIKDKERADIDEFIRGQENFSDKLQIPDAIVNQIREAEEAQEAKPAKKKAAPKKKAEEKVDEVPEVEEAPETPEADTEEDA